MAKRRKSEMDIARQRWNIEAELHNRLINGQISEAQYNSRADKVERISNRYKHNILNTKSQRNADKKFEQMRTNLKLGDKKLYHFLRKNGERKYARSTYMGLRNANSKG